MKGQINMLAIFIALLAGIVIGLLIFFLLARGSRGALFASEEGTTFSERDAEALLQRTGYQIVGRQERRTIMTNVNGKDRFGYLEADYIVTKRNRRFVVLVKTGEGISDPNEPSLRRRLLEYDHVFSPDALLFIDLDNGQIYRVFFNFPSERNIDFFFFSLIALFIILIIIGIIWLMAQMHLF